MQVKLVQVWQQRATRAKSIPVSHCCQLIGLSPSSYYAITGQQALPPKVDALPLALKAAFIASGQTYGSRRLLRVLNKQGFTVGRHRVRSMMKASALNPVWKRKFVRTTDSRHTGRIAPNLLHQNFNVSAPTRVWVADITYIRTQSGWLYLAAVMDLYARKIVGWSLASHMRASLVCSALNMAIVTRQLAAGLVVHTDQGSQYASDDYLALLAKQEITASMSGRGNCYELAFSRHLHAVQSSHNAVMERFFLNLKMERVWQTHYDNHQEAVKDVSHYIVAFYNGCRLHSSLGYLSPNQFEAKLTENQQIMSIEVSSFS